MNYTKEQLAIFEFVRSGEGNAIIDAVAGAGKTTTIMECVKHVPSSKSLLFCAFNKSIQTEIDRKFNQRGLYAVTTKTSHSLGLQILNSYLGGDRKMRLKAFKYSQILGNEEVFTELLPHFQILLKLEDLKYDEFSDKQNSDVKNELFSIREILLEINAKYRLTLCGDSLSEIKLLVDHFGIFTQEEQELKDYEVRIKAYKACHEILLARGNQLAKDQHIIDFADMLYLPYLWSLHPSSRYDYLFIDECQDLSKAQLEVVMKYAKPDARIMAVGDPYQSIYGFAGADVESFERIEKRIQAKRLPLTTCFRCPTQVIKKAQNIRSDITGSKNYPGTLETIEFKDMKKLVQLNDLVISRKKAPLLLLIFQLLDENFDVEVHPDIVNDLIGALKKRFKTEELEQSIKETYQDFDELKKKVQGRGEWIIDQNVNKIGNLEERQKQSETEKYLLNQELNFIGKFYARLQPDVHTVQQVLNRIHEKVSGSNKEAIRLSTIHTAKGLEEDCVFILNYNEMPLKRPDQKHWETIQERNLEYVGLTRAKEELYLVEAIKA